MKLVILTEEELKRIVAEGVKEGLKVALPSAIRQSMRKQVLNTTDVMKILQCSRRHVQYLRDTKQLAFTQIARTIRYQIEDVEAFLNDGYIDVRTDYK